jgi:hypothetical protein
VSAASTGSTRSASVRPREAVVGERAHRLDLADRAHLGRAVRAILEAAVDEDASDDVVVGAAHVSHHVIKHVAATVAPHVVVHIDDW